MMLCVPEKDMIWEKVCLFVAALLIMTSCKTQGLMYRLPMDTIIGDILQGDVNMTLHGGATLVPGVRGMALSFNGDNQYAEIENHTCFTNLRCGGYTFAMWIKLNESMLTKQKPIFSSGGLDKDIIAYGGVTLVVGKGTLKLNFKRVDNKKWKAMTPVSGLGNQWMHIAGTWAPEGFVSLYKDGTLNDTNEQTRPEKNGEVSKNTMTVGTLNDGQFVIDEWLFWDWELSGHQVAQVYAAYQTELEIISLAMDGNLTTCLQTSVLNPNRVNLMLGEMTLIKDVNETRRKVNITYGGNVLCMDVNIVHYRRVTAACSFLKTAALEAGSAHTGSTCYYEVLCDHGNVTCIVEFAFVDGNVDFSVCELEL